MPKISVQSTIARRKKESEERRNYLLNMAESMFRVKGYFLTTADEIAEKAGFSVGTLYNLFESKEMLYANVIERIGEQIIKFVRENICTCDDPDFAIEELIRFRILNFKQQRLFFALFSSEYSSGVYPEFEVISKRVFSSYYQYLNLVGKLFEQGMEKGRFERMHPLNLAISFEGMLNGFFNYWSRPEQSGNSTQQIKNIKQTFLQMIGLKLAAKDSSALDAGISCARREVYIGKFDFERLQELLVVARGFGNLECRQYLDALEKELSIAQIVDPKQVPPDIVTMNSRLRLRNLNTGEKSTVTLVFPADVKNGRTEVSILHPLGTALLGCGVGREIEVAASGDKNTYRLEEILYQPESAGDFQL